MLIIGGHKIEGSDHVIDWGDHGMRFRPWRGARPRTKSIDRFVLHWTGGEGSAHAVYQTLHHKKLGVEFIIDRCGSIIQTCDPLKVSTINVGRGHKFNDRQVAVEIVNHGFVWPRWRSTPQKGRDRPKATMRFKGMKLDIADFYQSQIESVLWLVDALTDALPSIKRTVPNENGKVIHRTMRPIEERSFSGICGHYHLSRTKIDPGPTLIDLVAGRMK